MRPSMILVARAFGRIVPVLAFAVTVAGCSASGKLSGPNWNLTGGKGAAPIPERPINAHPPQPAGLPAPERQPPIYRGGRDPVSGRAPTWGGPPQGFQPRAAQHPATQPLQPTSQPAATPVYRPQSGAAPGGYAPPRIEVKPGQSLASIATQHRVSIASLMQVNGLRDAYVIPGQTLVIPPR